MSSYPKTLSGTDDATTGEWQPGVSVFSMVSFAETSTALAAGATRTGTSRTTNSTSTRSVAMGRFWAYYYSDQPGTLQIEYSADNANWYPADAATVTQANVPARISAPSMFTYSRVKVVNTGAADTTVTVLRTAQTPM